MAEKENRKETRQWFGSPITRCDICRDPIIDKFVDGKIAKSGHWGIMCPTCHAVVGCGIGVGKGQRYHKVWEKD
jgi:hypothetical protein